MEREKILNALKSAPEPLTAEEISELTGIDPIRLRIDLYRLREEGKIDSKRKGGKVRWAIRSRPPIEKRYEKLIKKYLG
ncbi:MAG: hypothetical protein APU95_04040 [Hadesarchaea archaeon YNP_N21]|jgi:DNA-binding transcriptional ArsR family regulator|nr:MAG: hypothetical protein APU95_04040 [Hadesarchaea archaeon YNP_N21]